MINPVNHGRTAETEAIYKVEPYVVAADVRGRRTPGAADTWYTGSAGWMYRLIVESLLGLKLEGDRLHITPAQPSGANSSCAIAIAKPNTHHGAACGRRTRAVTVDGIAQDDTFIRLVDDQQNARSRSASKRQIAGERLVTCYLNC